MVRLVFIGLLVFAAIVFGEERPGTCPASSGLAGICVMRPGNCLDDSECAAGYKCCSEGCGRVCKAALHAVSHSGDCPNPSGSISICVFVKGYNCLSDSECNADERCCSEGCGKVCKKTV